MQLWLNHATKQVRNATQTNPHKPSHYQRSKSNLWRPISTNTTASNRTWSDANDYRFVDVNNQKSKLKGAFPMFRTIHVKTVLCKNWLYWVLYTIFVLLIIVLFWLRCDSFDFRYFVQFCFRRNGFSSSMRAHSWLEW